MPQSVTHDNVSFTLDPFFLTRDGPQGKLRALLSVNAPYTALAHGLLSKKAEIQIPEEDTRD